MVRVHVFVVEVGEGAGGGGGGGGGSWVADCLYSQAACFRAPIINIVRIIVIVVAIVVIIDKGILLYGGGRGAAIDRARGHIQESLALPLDAQEEGLRGNRYGAIYYFEVEGVGSGNCEVGGLGAEDRTVLDWSFPLEKGFYGA
ncbi:MAG: hypothetical protein Q9217_006702 [Psora testacea]